MVAAIKYKQIDKDACYTREVDHIFTEVIKIQV